MSRKRGSALLLITARNKTLAEERPDRRQRPVGPYDKAAFCLVESANLRTIRECQQLTGGQFSTNNRKEANDERTNDNPKHPKMGIRRRKAVASEECAVPPMSHKHPFADAGR